MSGEDNKTFVSHILRYTADPVRDEWLNIGVFIFDPSNGECAARVIDEAPELTRLRRLQPNVDEDVIRRTREHFEDDFGRLVRQFRAETSGTLEEFHRLVEKWEGTLSTGIQLSGQKGTYAPDLQTELNRLYTDHVGLERNRFRVGAPGSRAMMRDYCSQVWHQARLWERIEKSMRVAQYTFPGDPMRIDYAYRRNGTRGFVQTISVSRSPMAYKEYAHTAQYIAPRAAFKSEFAAITDVPLDDGNLRHRFVRDTLRDAGIEPIPMEGFAVWVAKLKPMLLQ
jgi:hypothetical protein